MYSLKMKALFLTKWLIFAPSRGPNKFSLFKYLNRFICNLTVKQFYAKEASNKPAEGAQSVETGMTDSPDK